MILSDKTIQSLLDSKKLIVKDRAEDAVQPCSIDLALGASALIVKYWNTGGVLDFDSPMEHQKISGKEIIIPPQSFILAATKEYIELPDNISAFVEGRSSVGRMGLFIQTAGVVVPGFRGTLTLELYNANILPIRLRAGRKICQLILFQMDQPAGRPYRGKYQNQRETTATKAFLERDKT